MVLNQPSLQSPNCDTRELSKLRVVPVRSLNFTKMFLFQMPVW